MEPLRAPLLQSLEQVRPKVLTLPFYSCVTAEFNRELTLDAEYWWRNLREPVLFSDTMRLLLESGYQNFIEVSPHPIGLISIQQAMYHLGVEGTALPSFRRDEDERAVMLDSLGRLYASGHDVNWKALFPGGGKCVHLPTYPWRRDRYWFEVDEAAAEERLRSSRDGNRRRPLLGAPISPASSSLNHLWEFKVSQGRMPFLKDHGIQGMAVMPATAYVEMALEAAAQVFGERASLTSLKFDKALFIRKDAALTVQVGFSVSDQNGGEFHIYSRRDEERNWTLHTTGRIRFDSEEANESPDGAWETIRERCRNELSGNDFYSLLSEAGYNYGPSFRSIHTLWRRDTEAVAELQISDDLAAEAATYRFHPAVLDCCLQLLAATISRNDETAGNGIYVPVAIDEVHVKGRPSSGRMWAHASLRVDDERTREGNNNLKGDVSLRDELGRVLIELAGVELQ
jgi:acyl transferase domain-containing protein